ncbi:hypothetical protein [Mesorhizobium sp. WSM3873]|uniref:hypothetical protein n=1 Tax=Mesorhizobium sp. WSM3873 TaxID=1854056 RepID=UPI0018D3C4E1|nr:hypothetical protein [Mesorhizobium sp. WSM3873]
MEWDLRPKMKCAVCGGKRITLTYSPDTSPKDLNKAAGEQLLEPLPLSKFGSWAALL